MKIGPFKFNFTRAARWQDQASNAADWVRWDRDWRRKLGWRAGLVFWGKTNVKGSRVLLCRHWPHRLCWSWSIWVGKRREGYDGPMRFSIVVLRQYRSASLWLGSFYINLHWQDSSFMVAVGPDFKSDAPKIYWKHHLENAEPAGTA